MPSLITFRDCIDHVLTTAGDLGESQSMGWARSAVIQAYRDVTTASEWKCYRGTGRIIFAAPYSTGTIAYNSSTRALTLSNGTLPSWARYGTVRLDGQMPLFLPTSRDSDTQLTLSAEFCPQADVASGTGYTLFRSIYPLPPGTVDFSRPVLQNRLWQPWQASLEDWMRNQRLWLRTGLPFTYTLIINPLNPNQRQLAVWGTPLTNETMDFIYVRSGRPLVLDGYANWSSQSGATVGTSAAGVTSLIVSSMVDGRAVGSMVRLAPTGTTVPPGGETSASMYLSQHMITAVANPTDAPTTTALTLDSAVPYTTTSNQFTISDGVDLADHIVPSLFRRAEYYWAMMRRPDNLKNALGAYTMQLKDSMGRENDSPGVGSLLTFEGTSNYSFPYRMFLDGLQIPNT